MSRIRNLDHQDPVCLNYREGDCLNRPAVRMLRPLLPELHAASKPGVYESCPHAGPSLPVWLWQQPKCPAYHPATAADTC